MIEIHLIKRTVIFYKEKNKRSFEKNYNKVYVLNVEKFRNEVKVKNDCLDANVEFVYDTFLIQESELQSYLNKLIKCSTVMKVKECL